MMSCFPTQASDLDELWGEDQKAEQLQVKSMLSAATDSRSLLSSTSRTLVNEDDQIVAVLGVWPMWPGAGRCWALMPSDSLRRYPKSIHKFALSQLGALIERDSLRRVEAIVIDGHEAGHRWIQRLGFDHEGLMRNYGINGENCHLYARCL